MTKPSRRGLLRSVASAGAGTAVAAPLQNALAATPASAAAMRISRFEVFPTRVPMYEPVREAWEESYRRQDRFQTHYAPTMVRLHTDEGLTGIGNAGIPKGERLDAILKRLLGHSPWEFALDDSLGGVLAAVYDLLGKAAGLPVCRLFSSNPKPRVVQTWWSHCWPPELMAAEAKRGERLGYKVHKVKARPWQDPIEQAEAICDAVSKDFRVWVDANAWWGSIGRTQFYAEKLTNYRNYFAIESPIRRDIEGYRQLKGTLAFQLAEHMPADPMPFIREGLVDAFVVGGPMGRSLMQRALMAEVTGAPLWVEHSIEDGANQAFQAHQAAALPGIEYTISITHVLENDLVKEPFTMKDGYWEVPNKPGLGVTLDEEAVERYRSA